MLLSEPMRKIYTHDIHVCICFTSALSKRARGRYHEARKGYLGMVLDGGGEGRNIPEGGGIGEWRGREMGYTAKQEARIVIEEGHSEVNLISVKYVNSINTAPLSSAAGGDGTGKQGVPQSLHPDQLA